MADSPKPIARKRPSALAQALAAGAPAPSAPQDVPIRASPPGSASASLPGWPMASAPAAAADARLYGHAQYGASPAAEARIYSASPLSSHFHFITGRGASMGTFPQTLASEPSFAVRRQSSTLQSRRSSGQHEYTGGIILGQEPGLTSPLLQHQHSEHEADVEAAAGAFTAETPQGAAGNEHRNELVSIEEGHHGSSSGKRSSVRNDIVIGAVNALVGLPTMVAFVGVVYKDPLYSPLLGQLARFSFLSAALHQIMFTIFSTLPFAVGQPQDVGLIFLSAMATSVADIGREQGLDNDTIVGTTLLTLTMATTIVGAMTYLVAKLKLATLVQYVPLPVVGGYLGYVGYFCLAAGIGMGSNTQIDTFMSWGHLLTTDALIKFAVTFGTALVLLMTMKHARSPWALPLLLVAIPMCFHAYLLASGHTLAEAQEAGWVATPQGKSTQQFWELYSLFNIKDWRLDGIYLPAIPRQLAKVLGLFFVVTFGSCLDVAAIQADVPEPIDFNTELSTVGLSNIVVGLSGSGYTGSYIFSQTIFSMRMGVSSALHGIIIAAAEGAVFLLPFSVIQYLPNFFFGALLTVFGIEIIGDWLIRSYEKVTQAEYVLLLATFLAIMQFELEAGVAIGVLLCVLYFAWSYARMNLTAFNVVPSRSATVRSYKERLVLEASLNRNVAVSLNGYIFFGSSVLISAKVTELAEALVNGSTAPLYPKPHATTASAVNPADALTAHMAGAHPILGRVGSGAAALYGGSPEPVDEGKLALALSGAPHFVLLDFRRVLGVDATAAQTFGTLVLAMRRIGVELLLTRINNPTIRRLFVAHGLITPKEGDAGHGSGREGACLDFATLNDGAQHAEEVLLGLAKAAGALPRQEASLTLEQFLAGHLADGPLTAFGAESRAASSISTKGGTSTSYSSHELAAAASGLARFGRMREAAQGELLYEWGEAPTQFFLVLKGTIDIQVRRLDASPSALHVPEGLLGAKVADCKIQSGPGAVIGATDLVLQRPRSFRAEAASPCSLLCISAEAHQRMAQECPAAAAALQAILLRHACLSEISYAQEVLERSALS